MTPPTKNITLGKQGEDIAAEFLIKKHYKVIDRNFKARYGEIDLIALDGKTLVFVEVKTRTTDRFGTPEEAITARKLYELVKTSEYYVLQHPDLLKLTRIDVVGIMLDGVTNNVIRLTHTENVTG